jgi:hypothetical protein
MVPSFGCLLSAGNSQYCLAMPSVEGTITLAIVSDEEDGVERTRDIIRTAISSGQEIVIGTDHLGTTFVKKDRATLWRRLVQDYGSRLYMLTDTDRKRHEVAYVPMDGIDYVTSARGPCSVVLLDRHSPAALFALLNPHTMPPFPAVEVARLGCSIVAHSGLRRLFCSFGDPPSSQDIELFVRKSGELRELREMVFSLIQTPDVLYAIMKTPLTASAYDVGDFYLGYAETMTRFKIYGLNVARKIAALKACEYLKLALACTSLNRAKTDGTLVSEEDYVTWLRLRAESDKDQ